MSAVSSSSVEARALLTEGELLELLKVEVFDRVGTKKLLFDLVDGKRSVLIFTRHFWCLNCQAYVRTISETIPPSSLPPGTQILIIGNGSYQPIDTYASASTSAYPIYTDPTCQLHKILKFTSVLKEQSAGEEKKDYMQSAGTTVNRIFGGILGALGNLQHTAYIGPKSLNGGEVIIRKGTHGEPHQSPAVVEDRANYHADGECEYIYRMQNTVDHTNVADLARLIREPESTG